MTMTLPAARGPLTRALYAVLSDGTPAPGESTAPSVAHSVTQTIERLGDGLLVDDDFQLALWVSYAVHYVSIEGVPDDREWDPAVLAVRRALEAPFLEVLRRATGELVATAQSGPDDLSGRLFAMADDFEGPALAGYLQRRATRPQFLEFLKHRSAYAVRESEPQTFALARLTGAPKTAMAELLYDEFGAGRPEREHGTLFRDALASVGIDPRYGASADLLPGSSLVQTNAMNLFNLHRQHLHAAVGQFAAFEATSSEPARKILGGAHRLGLPDSVASYYDEHVEADAVHEQLMARAVCGAIVAQDPAAEREVLFGAATCLVLDAVANAPLLEAWRHGESSLLAPMPRQVAS